MASPPSPRLLCALLGDRLAALSARPLLRTAAPGRGHRRVTCQATRTLSSLVDALFNRRTSLEVGTMGLAEASWPEQRKNLDWLSSMELGVEVVQYTEEQIRRVEESIRIRREAEPVELVQAVKKLRKVFAREEKRRKELPLELKLRVSYELVGRLNGLGDNGTAIQQRG
uniref:Uncharacterized protein n=1 Tax=Aegilops tauschii TaxID=37682 RepID=N1QT58_AEGTA